MYQISAAQIPSPIFDDFTNEVAFVLFTYVFFWERGGQARDETVSTERVNYVNAPPYYPTRGGSCEYNNSLGVPDPIRKRFFEAVLYFGCNSAALDVATAVSYKM